MHHRAARPATNHSSHELSAKSLQYYPVVHALPMAISQLDCFHGHGEWHAAAKPRHNVLHPVSCAVCDGDGAPSEGHDAAGDDFKRCNWCWLMICGKCHDAFLKGGTTNMMTGREVGGVTDK